MNKLEHNQPRRLSGRPEGRASSQASPAADHARALARRLEEEVRHALVALEADGDAVVLDPPGTPEWFAAHAILAICSAGDTPASGRRAYERCRRALNFGATARMGFRHPGKADAIDYIWRERARLHAEFEAADDPLGFLTTLPWIGDATRTRLARRLGAVAADSVLNAWAASYGAHGAALCDALAGRLGLPASHLAADLSRALTLGLIAPARAADRAA